MADARFEDGGDAPLRLKALDVEDLKILSALCQDAVVPVAEITYRASDRRFVMLVNRFRWEDAPNAKQRNRSYERVQSLLFIEDAMAVKSQGVDRYDKDTVLSLLSVDFKPGEDGTGHVVLTFAGDGTVDVEVEALEVGVQDVTKPYVAPSGKSPNHD